MKRIAQALVECGYARMWQDLSSTDNEGTYHNGVQVGIPNETYPEINMIQLVDPFADTLKGRRQADVLEDWLVKTHDGLWMHSFAEYDDPTCYTGQTHHQWRLDRIKWCFEQLEQDHE